MACWTGRESTLLASDIAKSGQRARNGTSDRNPRPQTPAKKSDPLPKPGDPYRAHARFLNRLHADTPMIFFVLKDFSYEGFRYSDLRRLRWLPASKPGQGPSLLLRFVEADITDVTIEGDQPARRSSLDRAGHHALGVGKADGVQDSGGQRGASLPASPSARRRGGCLVRTERYAWPIMRRHNLGFDP